jgi:hypothetical protein
VLAASSDDRVRNGVRAMTISQQLFDAGEKSTSLGETMAMAQAEQGNFARAAAIQRDIMAASQKAGFTANVQRMAANLALYERSRPCRTPWIEEDLVSVPTAPVIARAPAGR